MKRIGRIRWIGSIGENHWRRFKMHDEALEKQVVTRLLAAGECIATAESCTGGLIGSRITDVPGASACFLGGVIAYSNEAKEHILKVDQVTLETYGAVSDETVREMVAGAQKAFDAEWAIAVTGIAGPTGGTPEKPVGLVYIAVQGPGRINVAKHLLKGSRKSIKQQTAESALRMVLELLNS